MRVADFIAQFIADHEQTAKTIFMVSGGGNMHLIDALGKNIGLEYVCNHHEQACAMAAEGYARVSNKIGIAYVTTGPGGTNAITGVMGAWVDSIPMLIISGQVKFETTIASQPELSLRQLGDQEINIVDIVRPITKYAVMINDKNTIKFHLAKAVYEAKHGRPGPVWIDIPLDIQGAQINPESLEGFSEPSEPVYDFRIDKVIAALKKAERPVIIAGNGIRLANAMDYFERVLEKYPIPVLTSISGIDLIDSDHKLFYGRPGILGERAANFILQNSDLLLILGARMSIRIISYNWQCLAREAFKIMVDLDDNELNKKTLDIDLKVKSDLKAFLECLADENNENIPVSNEWYHYCQRVRRLYPVVSEEHKNGRFVNSYYFAKLLSGYVASNDTVVTGNGTAYTSTFQAFDVRQNRLFANVGCASMGYDLPAAIGAHFASKGRVICITGDGSIQMNIQELQTIIHYKIPVIIFVFNNNGYLSIRATQRSFFNDHFVGEGPESGVTMPNMLRIAHAYGLKTFRIESNEELESGMNDIMKYEGPVLCEVMMDPFEVLGPKVSSYKKDNGTMVSKPLEDLFPFIDRNDFAENMIITKIIE